MNKVEFKTIKPKIQEALPEAMKKSGITAEEGGFVLIDGFFNQPFHAELTSSVVIGGPALPLVAVIGKASGRVYFFALKALIPDISN